MGVNEFCYFVKLSLYFPRKYESLSYIIAFTSLQSSHFDDFVADFCDRCFAIIENSIVLQTRAEVK